jgi:hypothetical protein
MASSRPCHLSQKPKNLKPWHFPTSHGQSVPTFIISFKYLSLTVSTQTLAQVIQIIIKWTLLSFPLARPHVISFIYSRVTPKIPMSFSLISLSASVFPFSPYAHILYLTMQELWTTYCFHIWVSTPYPTASACSVLLYSHSALYLANFYSSFKNPFRSPLPHEVCLNTHRTPAPGTMSCHFHFLFCSQ